MRVRRHLGETITRVSGNRRFSFPSAVVAATAAPRTVHVPVTEKRLSTDASYYRRGTVVQFSVRRARCRCLVVHCVCVRVMRDRRNVTVVAAAAAAAAAAAVISSSSSSTTTAATAAAATIVTIAGNDDSNHRRYHHSRSNVAPTS